MNANDRNKRRFLLMLVLSFLCLPWISEATVNVSVGVNTADFHFLADHGDWVTSPRYGRVWRPSVVSSWRPFDHGDWVWTDQGWMWTSYEPYGWAVYHYGNWHHEPRNGWVWIPGDEWSPARVSWVTYGDHIGWAPLAPRGVNLPDPWARSRVRYWIVVERRNFTRENVFQFRIKKARHPGSRIHIVRTSPRIIDVERVVNRKISVVKINTVEVKGGSKVFRRVQYAPDVDARIKVHRTRVEKDVVKVKVKKDTAKVDVKEKSKTKKGKEAKKTKVKVKETKKKKDKKE